MVNSVKCATCIVIGCLSISPITAMAVTLWEWNLSQQFSAYENVTMAVDDGDNVQSSRTSVATELAWEESRYRLTAAAAGSAARYTDVSELDDNHSELKTRGELYTQNATWALEIERRDEDELAQLLDDVAEEGILEGKVDHSIKFTAALTASERLKYQIDMSRQSTEYDVSAQSPYIDYEYDAFGVNANYALNELSQITLRLDGAAYRPDFSDRKSDSLGYEVGYARELAQTRSMRAFLGKRRAWQTFPGVNLGDTITEAVDSEYLGGDYRWQGLRSDIRFTVSSRFEPSGLSVLLQNDAIELASSYRSTDVSRWYSELELLRRRELGEQDNYNDLEQAKLSVGWNYHLTQNWELNTGVVWQGREYAERNEYADGEYLWVQLRYRSDTTTWY